jgi:chromate transporter
LRNSSPSPSAIATDVSLAEIALVFLKLGTIAFGGPAAHIAMMEAEFVRKRKWITEAEFLDRLGAANLIPGPSSTEVAIFIGYTKRGWRGLIVAGSCFIIPAAILVTLIAMVYVRYGSLPQVDGVLYGIKAVVIAIIAQALWKLGRTAVKTKFLAATGVLSVALSWLGVDPIVLLLIAGCVCAAVATIDKRAAKLGAIGWAAVTAAATIAVVPVSLGRLSFSFLKMGSVVFGSGYVLLAFLRTEFVTGLHWLTEKQLIDAVAVGQFTPGPLFTTATFIGYVVAGIPGAIVATVGIFLPGFLLVAASGPLIPKIRHSQTAGAALDGVIVASLALMAVVTYQLGRAALVDWITVIIALASLGALLRLRLSPVWLLAIAAVIGGLVKR